MKKRGKIIRFFLLLIIVFSSVWFLSQGENQEKLVSLIEGADIRDRLNSDISFNISKTIPLEITSEDIGYYGNPILWDGQTLTKIKEDGEVIKEKGFNFQDLGIYMGEGHIYVYEKPSGEIYILDKDLNTIDRLKMENRVENLVESGDQLIIHMEEILGESIAILNRDGEIKEKIITENRNILNYAVNSRGNKYLISTLALEAAGLRSRVQAFQVAGQELFSHEFNDQVIVFTEFLDGDKFILATDRSLYCIIEGEIAWTRAYKSLKDIILANGNIYLLHSNIVEVLGLDGQEKFSLSLSEDYKSIIPFRKHLVLYGPQYIIGLDEGEEIFKHKSNDMIKKIIKVRDKILILNENTMEIGDF